MPQVPTISESGLPGFDIDAWIGIVGPARLPDVQKRMSTLGMNFDFHGSDQFRELIVREHEKYRMVICEAGIQPA